MLDSLMVSYFLYLAHAFEVELSPEKRDELRLIAGGTLPEPIPPYRPATKHDGPCERCRYDRPPYHRHHLIKQEHWGRASGDNLRTICAECHDELHALEVAGGVGVVDVWWQLQVWSLVRRELLQKCLRRGHPNGYTPPLDHYLGDRYRGALERLEARIGRGERSVTPSGS